MTTPTITSELRIKRENRLIYRARNARLEIFTKIDEKFIWQLLWHTHIGETVLHSVVRSPLFYIQISFEK